MRNYPWRLPPVLKFQQLLHENNALIKVFKTLLENMSSDNYTIVIKPDKTPTGEYGGHFNASTINEVAVVIVGQQFDRRDIILKKRGSNMQRIAETHISHDALQYPLLFWEGEDEYHFGVLQFDPTTKTPSNKKVMAINFYAYRLITRNDCDYLLRYGRIF